jgi:hypothetical protein
MEPHQVPLSPVLYNDVMATGLSCGLPGTD